MDIPPYLKILWSYKWLLVIGAIVAAAAAFIAGFTVTDGKIVSRATSSYTAATTIMIGSDNSQLFQAEIPGQTLQPNTTAPEQPNFAQTAVVYAYLISSNDIQKQVEQQVGKFAVTDTLTAVSRTTQPSGSEAFPGRLQLPFINIEGTSNDPARAEKIAQVANTVFQKYVTEQQTTANIAPAQRVEITTISNGPAVAGTGSNPAIPLVATGAGVFLAFVALAFVLYNVRLSREKARASRGRREKSITAEGLSVIDEDGPREVGGSEFPPIAAQGRRSVDSPEPALTGSHD